MSIKTLSSVAVLTLAGVTSVAAEPVIDGAFEIQPYEMPNGQGYRHMTSAINEQAKELILFGGLVGSPSSGPYNFNVYTLDLTKSPSEQQWEQRSTESVVLSPWFTSTRGFIELNNNYYLACDDSDQNAIYTFNPDTYKFELLSTSTLPPEVNGGDCCAVGVTITNSRDHNQNKEERIYILGGRNEYYFAPGNQSPLPNVRYYSITHGEWGQAQDLNVGRSHLGCVSVEQKGEPLIYAIGGGDQQTGEALRSMEVYNVIQDEWTLYDDYFPEGKGRTRLGVKNIDDKYLLLIGGDSTCAGGGSPNNCAPDQPVTWVDMVDIKNDNRLISGDGVIPQLQLPRQTPATSLREIKGKNRKGKSDHQKDKSVLYVVGGRTRNEAGLDVLPTTEVLSFDRINVENLQPKNRP